MDSQVIHYLLTGWKGLIAILRDLTVGRVKFTDSQRMELDHMRQVLTDIIDAQKVLADE